MTRAANERRVRIAHIVLSHANKKIRLHRSLTKSLKKQGNIPKDIIYLLQYYAEHILELCIHLIEFNIVILCVVIRR